MTAQTTRFAPSPSGLLHMGNVRTALFSLLAALPDGRFLVRIEDTDRARADRVFEKAALADLDWLGMGAFVDPGAILYQSARASFYNGYLEQLVAARSVYPCFCSQDVLADERASAQAKGLPPRYSGRCGRLDWDVAQTRLRGGEAAVWRFRVPVGEEVYFEDIVRGSQRIATDLLGDFVVRRANGEAMFFFSNALDDALSGVTLVLRGEDHLSNTARQILLLRALGLSIPEYGHLPLVLSEAGVPLSKRDGAGSLAALREEGFLPLAIVNYLARLGAVVASDALLTIPELAVLFDCRRIGHAPARYDRQQLLHWQRLAVAHAPLDAWLPYVPSVVPVGDRLRFLEGTRANVLFPQDFTLWGHILYGEDGEPMAEARHVIAESAPGFFGEASAFLRAGGAPQNLPQALKAAGYSGKALFHGLRAALTGRLAGPELKDVLTLMPTPVVMRRLARYEMTNAQDL